MTFSHKRRKWAIEHKPELRDDEGNLCHALLDIDARTIYVNADGKRDERESAVIHEALHLALPEHTEENILSVEKLIFAVLKAYREM